MSQRSWQRWAPLTGVVFVVLMIVGFAIAGSSPSTDDSNAKIARYLAKSSNQDRNVVAFFIVLLAMLFLVAFFASLRARLVRAEGNVNRLSSLAFGAGVISTTLLVTAIAIFVSPIFTAGDADAFSIDPGIYRVTQDLGYEIWVASTVVATLAIWATAAISRQTGMLPGWFVWFSVVAGVITLFAVFFFPIFVYWLWIAVTSVLLSLRPVEPVEVRPTPAVEPL
jgi:hypothetical protein